ncbi:MAG: hypothetical protein V3V22_00775 [Methylococcales bacterium]
MFKNRYVSGLFLLGFIVLSYFVLIKFVTPMVVDTTTSDLFIEDTGDYRIEGPSNTNMTNTAANFCFDELANEHEEIRKINFSQLKQTAYALGGYHYVVKATIPAAQSADNQPHIMTCQIVYDHTSEAPNSADNWTINGLTYTIPE